MHKRALKLDQLQQDDIFCEQVLGNLTSALLDEFILGAVPTISKADSVMDRQQRVTIRIDSQSTPHLKAELRTADGQQCKSKSLKSG